MNIEDFLKQSIEIVKKYLDEKYNPDSDLSISPIWSGMSDNKYTALLNSSKEDDESYYETIYNEEDKSWQFNIYEKIEQNDDNN